MTTAKVQKISLREHIQSYPQKGEDLPNPESDRQIANEIAELHLKPQLFPSFDKDDGTNS